MLLSMLKMILLIQKLEQLFLLLTTQLLPQNTIRAWVIGLILTTVGCGMNMLFSFHSPSFAITTFVTSILAWPIGNFWAWIVPDWKIFGASLNPGPFNVKEHTIITIMANVSFGTGAAYATDILLAQNMFINQILVGGTIYYLSGYPMYWVCFRRCFERDLLLTVQGHLASEFGHRNILD